MSHLQTSPSSEHHNGGHNKPTHPNPPGDPSTQLPNAVIWHSLKRSTEASHRSRSNYHQTDSVPETQPGWKYTKHETLLSRSNPGAYRIESCFQIKPTRRNVTNRKVSTAEPRRWLGSHYTLSSRCRHNASRQPQLRPPCLLSISPEAAYHRDRR